MASPAREPSAHGRGPSPGAGKLRHPPVIGVTCDLVEIDGIERTICASGYAAAIAAAGGVPVLLPPIPELVADHVCTCAAFVLTGGDDPRTEAFGVPTHPRAKPIHSRRQEYELALLEELRRQSPAAPVLGVCLGMQLMALHAGGRLNQHMPDNVPTHAQHRRATHAVRPAPAKSISAAPASAAAGTRIDATDLLGLPVGTVLSNHRQCVDDPGSLAVIAAAEDGVIEAVASRDPARPFYLGVQWHPERTADAGLGAGLFERLIRATA